MIEYFGVISVKRTFKGFSEEHRMIILNDYKTLSEGKTNSGRFSIDWTKPIEGIKIPHRKEDCLVCINGLMRCECVVKRKMDCFNCDVARTCKSCLDLVRENKTYSTDITMLKGNLQRNFNKCLLNM